jgi:hypothetical protein
MAEPEVPSIAGSAPVFESAFGVSQARLHRSELVLFPQVVTSLWRVHLRLCNPAQTFTSTGEGEQGLGGQRTRRLESPL